MMELLRKGESGRQDLVGGWRGVSLQECIFPVSHFSASSPSQGKELSPTMPSSPGWTDK